MSVELILDGTRYTCQIAPPPEPTGAPWRDVIATMPTNPTPDASKLIAQRGGWWKRELSQIDGIAIHHTLGHDPIATANYCTKPTAQNGKGHSTTQYHIWITKEGEALLCVPLTEGLWHDHTGDRNTHISIGLAGSLHKGKPPQAQLDKAAEVTAYLMHLYKIAGGNVAGHNDWAWKAAKVKTTCPGWDVAGWRSEFYAALNKALGK